ncbi:MAG: type I 3-dehydroquinate dehydratase [Ruminococcaceae bacterium]|nr:type I 3-dehydroquinate dehydratase [Oscillospiraceae bacterium]
MKPTFLNYEKPLLTAMIQYLTPEECILKIKASLADGAEAIGIQLDKLKKEYQTPEYFKMIFDSCEGKPIYVTSYRYGNDETETDEQRAENLLMALDCGATMCDVMGDMFDPSPQYELTLEPEAVKKQTELIDEIHRRGGEVLISSHTYKSISLDECIMIAKEQIKRGADIIKIVNHANTADEVPKYIDAIQKITAMTDRKLLFLVSGKGEIIRYIGPNFGVCMYLCVQHHGEMDTTEQPLLSKIKAIRDNIRFDF